MRQNLRHQWIFAMTLLLAVSAFGQERPQWRASADVREGNRGSAIGTVSDIDSARNQIQLALDEAGAGGLLIQADAVSTQYAGFGRVGEVSRGSAGFASVRVGDRVEVRGIGRANGLVTAEHVMLLGRPITSEQTTDASGTTTRTTTIGRSSAGTSGPGTTGSGTLGGATTTAGAYNRFEGVVRQVNAADRRIVIETDRREILTVRTAANTPVFYRGEVFQVVNLEQGDRVRVDPEPGVTGERDVRARSIDVITSRQDAGGSGARTVAQITGRITRVDRSSDVIRVDTGRGEVRVDLVNAADATGRRVRAADLQVGDNVDVSGSYGSSGDVFMASTVRYSEDVFSPAPGGGSADRAPAPAVGGEMVTVSLSATIVESLATSPTLVIRDRASERTMELFATTDFVVRTRNGYTTADRLAEGDAIVVKAYRDRDDNLVAQTIRVR